MKPLYVKVILYDPATDTDANWEGFPVFDGIRVDLAHVDPDDPENPEEVLTLAPDPVRRLFFTTSRLYRVDEGHYLRVSFDKRSFSKATGALHTPEDIQTHQLASLCLSLNFPPTL